VNVVVPSIIHLVRLCADARPDEIRQYMALTGDAWDAERVAVDHYNRHGIKFALLDNDCMPIAAGGWDPIAPGVWQSWMVGTMENWTRYWRSLTKASRMVMDDLFEHQGARRLQTNACADREAACHWYEKGLLMTREGVMRGFGMNGEDVAMYSRIKGDRRRG
jgi:hypothetical protein